jgi:hypothetical protein
MYPFHGDANLSESYAFKGFSDNNLNQQIAELQAETIL